MLRRLLVLGFTALLALTAFASEARGEDAFSGTWSITLTPDDAASRDGAKTFADAMVFEESELLTESFAFYGFNPGAYTIPVDAPASFTATLDSNHKGTLAWSGNVVGTSISGTLVWNKADGSVWRFTFTGSRQAN